MSDLKPCPCGQTPDKLVVMDAGQGGKYANVAGDCCGAWVSEFRTSYESLDSDQCMKYAIEAWNELPRMQPSPQQLLEEFSEEINNMSAEDVMKEIYIELGREKQKLLEDNAELKAKIAKLKDKHHRLELRYIGDHVQCPHCHKTFIPRR